jgi:phosphonate transport system substrate-binding protein
MIRALSILTVGVFAALSSALAADKFVIALKPDKDPDKMFEERESLAEFVRGATKRDAQVITPLSNAVIFEGMANGTLDAAFVGSSEFVAAEKLKAAEVLLATEINGKNSYQSYWVCLKEKPYKGIVDLKGKSVAFASRTSTSGYAVPVWAMFQKGLIAEGGSPSDFFGNVWYGTGYVSAVERVLQGDAEAAACSYYVLDEGRYLKPEQRAKLRKLEEQGPVPTHIIAVRSSLPAADRESLAKALLGLNEDEFTGLRDKVFGAKLIKVDGAEHVKPIVPVIEFLKKIRP